MKTVFRLVVVILAFGLCTQAYAQGRQPITPANGSTVIELARLGRSSTDRVAFSPDGQTVAVSSKIGVWLYPVTALDTPTEPPLLQTPKNAAAMAFSPDGKTLVTASDYHLQFWNLATREMTNNVEVRSTPRALAYSPDGLLLAMNMGWNGLILWDAATLTEKAKIEASLQEVAPIVFSADGGLIVGSTSNYKVHVWKVADGQEVALLEGHEGYVYDIALSTDGKLLATASYDSSVRLWTFPDGKEKAVLKGTKEKPLDRGYAVAFSPDGKLITSGHSKGQVAIWTESGEQVAITGPGDGEVEDLAFSPDGKYLLTASSLQALQLWEVATGTVAKAAVGHTSYISAVAFSPDNATLAVTAWSKRLWLWDTTQRPELHTSTMTEAETSTGTRNTSMMIYAPNGKQIATTDTFDVYLRDPATGAEIGKLTDCPGVIQSFVFSPDSSLIAIASSNGLCLFDVEKAALLVAHPTNDWLDSVVFSPDQTLIAASGKDNTARVYGLR